RFAPDGETRALGVAWTGNAAVEHWSGGARDVDFFDVKGVAERVCDALGVAVRCEPASPPFLVAGQGASISIDNGPSRGESIGIVGQVTPAIADARGLPRQDRVFVVELNLDRLAAVFSSTSDAARPVPRYPFVVRDVSIGVSDSLPAEIIRG